VGTLIDTDATESLENWLAVLLPLEVPQPSGNLADPLSELSKTAPEFSDPPISKLVAASSRGAAAVEDEFQHLIREPLETFDLEEPG
jgi:hypothetical protein